MADQPIDSGAGRCRDDTRRRENLEQLEREVNLLHEKICRGIGDPKRILILYELSRCPLRVNELAEALNMPQPTVSRHLKVLRERSLVLAERDGTSVVYSLADPRIIQALDLMCEVLKTILRREAELARFSALEEADLD